METGQQKCVRVIYILLTRCGLGRASRSYSSNLYCNNLWVEQCPGLRNSFAELIDRNDKLSQSQFSVRRTQRLLLQNKRLG